MYIHKQRIVISKISHHVECTIISSTSLQIYMYYDLDVKSKSEIDHRLNGACSR